MHVSLVHISEFEALLLQLVTSVMPVMEVSFIALYFIKKREIIFQVVGTNRHIDEVSESDPFPLSTMAPTL